MARRKRKLTSDEMKSMEMNHLEKRLRKTEIDLESQKLISHKLQKELLIKKLDEQQQKLSDQINEMKKRDEKLKKGYLEFVNGLKKKHKIESDNFGYNPDTGEILEEE